MKIPFNKIYLTYNEIKNISEVLDKKKLTGGYKYTINSIKKIKSLTKSKEVFLTHTCTSALEFCTLISDFSINDEIIMPAYTFVSSANPFILRRCKIVFVDIRKDTLNIDEKKIEEKITKKTKAILVMHYGAVACEMDYIISTAKKYNLIVIEDAAHCIMSYYKNRHLGSIGNYGAFSFHDTKNLTCGEGGALLINSNNQKILNKASKIFEKGTNKNDFLQKKVKKYEWVDIGSSFSLNEISASILFAQLEKIVDITNKRLEIWNYYNEIFKSLEKLGFVRCPKIHKYCKHNGHIFYLIVESKKLRDKLLLYLNRNGIAASFHYSPLNETNQAKKFAKNYSEPLKNTSILSRRLIRLPLWVGLTSGQQNYIYEKFKKGIHLI